MISLEQLANENRRLREIILGQGKRECRNDRPSKDVLLSLLEKLGSKRAVGKALLKDENQIRRWCKYYGITNIKGNSRIVIELLKKEMSGLEYKKIKQKPIIDPSGETLVIDLGDWHAGKEIKDENGKIIFSEDILTKRINKGLFPEILSLLDNRIKRATKITDIVMLLSGDMADGSNIYPTQQYQQYIAPPRQVKLCVELIIPLIENLVNRGLLVSIYAVRGNHGRGLKMESPENNWDTMLYLWLQLEVNKFKDVTLRFSDLDYINFQVRGWNYHLRHIAPEQDDTAAGRAKFAGWKDIHNFNAICYGHYHHFGITDFYGGRRFRNGCVSGWDDLSEKMAKIADPVQLIWGCSNNRVCSFLYPVDLKGDK